MPRIAPDSRPISSGRAVRSGIRTRDGDYRTLTVSASQLDALFAALGPEGGILCIEEVGDLLHRHREHDGCDEAMRIHAPDGLAYAWCRPDMAALDARGEAAGFQKLQGRINVSVPGYRSSAPAQTACSASGAPPMLATTSKRWPSVVIAG